jgi:predicted nucleic acid-binding protein
VIVVDTSVWVSALRVPNSHEAKTLGSLLDADEVALPVSVRSELLMGVTGQTRQQLADRLSALPLLYPSDSSWRTLDSWTERASRSGHFFSLGDLFVGILADELGGLVWSLESDFVRLEKLELVRLYST